APFPSITGGQPLVLPGSASSESIANVPARSSLANEVHDRRADIVHLLEVHHPIDDPAERIFARGHRGEAGAVQKLACQLFRGHRSLWASKGIGDRSGPGRCAGLDLEPPAAGGLRTSSGLVG